jgi:hypothetical protein
MIEGRQQTRFAFEANMFLPLYRFHLATVYGLQESDLGDTVREIAKTLTIEVQDDPAPQRNVFIRSDQYRFIPQGVPSLMVAFGNKKGSSEEQIEQDWLKNRYHAPSDDLNQPVDRQAAGEYNLDSRVLCSLSSPLSYVRSNC